MAAADGKALSNLTVLVTRPEYQQSNLVQLIENEGGHAWRFATLAIAPVADQQKLADQLRQLEQFDIAIFVSPNAADYAYQALEENGLTLPSSLKLACVGKGCAQAVEQHGRSVDAMPVTGIGSDGLLQHALLQEVTNKRVIIFRGNGGRELLADTLSQRGAQVEYCECYRRAIPQTDAAGLIDSWRNGGIDVVTITSTQALKNLRSMLGEHADSLLSTTPVIAISQRIAETARELGSQVVLVTDDTSDEAIVDCIKRWRANQFPI